ncbi:Hypothetical predicted protein [Mytilus galloprovincialis]|uniref:Mitochondria-eating protein n=1 Tax=Mytilus galloprovincialis TaxID=29158 RepID=A0A8B6GVA2_MYTGA|nr:Hypothetical predicted protein [Mytilus galloprovincialis]
MSSLFSCLGKKSKTKKKNKGKPPEAKQVEDQPKDDGGDKDIHIEEDIPADKVNGHLNNDEEEEIDTGPVQCTEETQEVTLIKELKSKLSIKKECEIKDDNSDKTTEVKNDQVNKGPEVSEIIERAAIKSVGAEIVKIEAQAKDKGKLLISESISETNLKQTNHQLSEQNQKLKRSFEEGEKEILKQQEDIQNLKSECSTLRANLNAHMEMKDIIRDRNDILSSVEELTNVCSSLKLRLDEAENGKQLKDKPASDLESKISSVDSEHKGLSVSIKNTLRSVQELECRVINLELDKESDMENTDESVSNFKEMESLKAKFEQDLIVALDKGKEQMNHLKSLEGQVEKLSSEISELQKENKQLKAQNSHDKETEKLNQLNTFENKVGKLNQDITQLVEENKELKCQLEAKKDDENLMKSLEGQNNTQNKELSRLEEENTKLAVQISNDTGKFKQLEQLKTLEKQVESQKTELAQLLEENRQLMDQVNNGVGKTNSLNSIKNQVENLNKEISDLQSKNKMLEDKMGESVKSTKTKDEKLSSLQNIETDLQNKIHNMESKMEQYEARHKSETQEMVNLKKKLEKLESQLREKEIAHQDTIRKLAEAQSKQEEIKKRLSHVANEKASPINNISLMSCNGDEGPVQIGEKFRELYNTVWREAFDKVHTVCKRDERKVLLILMEYLTECYLYCRRTARHQMDALLSLLVSPTNMRGSLHKRLQGRAGSIDHIPPGLKQNIMAFRRTPSDNFIECIFEEFMNVVDYQKSRHLRNIQARDITEVTPFVRKCIGVCWEMVTQEPPMYLLFKLRHNQIIEKDRFDTYSSDGNKVDFLVWPALMRDENGPILEKGVVQAIRS